MPTYQIRVNGQRRTVQAEADSPLLYVLRDQLELNGPKFGCGLGQCGACTVPSPSLPSAAMARPRSMSARWTLATARALRSDRSPPTSWTCPSTASRW